MKLPTHIPADIKIGIVPILMAVASWFFVLGMLSLFYGRVVPSIVFIGVGAGLMVLSRSMK